MNVDMCLIQGLSLGMEYVSADEDQDIEYPCLVVDMLVFRVIVEFTD